jgi:hypothetical protein
MAEPVTAVLDEPLVDVPPDEPPTPPKRRIRVRDRSKATGRPDTPPKKPGSHHVTNASVVNRAIAELELLYGLIGAGTRFVDPVAGEVIVERREDLAGSWRNLLATNKAVRDFFAASEKYSAWLPVIAVHAQVAAAIMAGHAMAAHGVVTSSEPGEEPAAPVFDWTDLADGSGPGE